MITIGITGTLGAGKGTIVDYLVKNQLLWCLHLAIQYEYGLP